MPNEVNGVALGAVLLGGVFMWAGITGKSVLATIQAAVQGTSPAGLSQSKPIGVPGQKNAAGEQTPSDTTGLSGSGPVGGTAGENQAIGKRLAQPYGWASGPEWTALVNLWNGESGWRNTATGSHTKDGRAYGIPQALPYDKMPKAAWPPQGIDGHPGGGVSSASAQIAWGLAYIKGVYGSPSQAWAQWQARSPHWY
jgi:hypothetical protein